jgi:hypothetical protein
VRRRRIENEANAVGRTIRAHTLTPKNVPLADFDGGARHWTITMTLIQMAGLNDGKRPLKALCMA